MPGERGPYSPYRERARTLANKACDLRSSTLTGVLRSLMLASEIGRHVPMETLLTLVIAVGGIATAIGAIWEAVIARRQARATEQSLIEQGQFLREQNERAHLTPSNGPKTDEAGLRFSTPCRSQSALELTLGQDSSKGVR